ncbi:MAG: hypothetical protein ACFFBD_30500 [Candidatus Hodarchaeota archaeon]
MVRMCIISDVISKDQQSLLKDIIAIPWLEAPEYELSSFPILVIDQNIQEEKVSISLSFKIAPKLKMSFW